MLANLFSYLINREWEQQTFDVRFPFAASKGDTVHLGNDAYEMPEGRTFSDQAELNDYLLMLRLG